MQKINEIIQNHEKCLNLQCKSIKATQDTHKTLSNILQMNLLTNNRTGLFDIYESLKANSEYEVEDTHRETARAVIDAGSALSFLS